MLKVCVLHESSSRRFVQSSLAFTEIFILVFQDFENQMDIAEKRRQTLLKDFLVL